MNDGLLLEQVRKDIAEYQLITYGDGLVTGVSGGADSVCLLSVLKKLQGEFDLKLTAVHINHGLRGEESDGDQVFVEELCKSWNIPLKSFKTDLAELSKKTGTSLEEAGREFRYSCFNEVLEETRAASIAVAHNLEDQAETVMLHILRGTGLDGLCGISMKQGRIIRPLLNVSRSQIIGYLTHNTLPYRTDSSNLTVEYTRNKVRNILFPQLKELFAVDPTKQLVRLSKLMQEERGYLEDAAEKVFSSILLNASDTIELDVNELKTLPVALLKRIIRRAWEKIKGNRKNLEQVHVEQMVNLCHNGHTGSRVHLPLGIEARVSYNRLILSKRGAKQQISFAYPIEREGIIKIDELKGALHSRVLPAAEAFAQYGHPGTIRENALIQLFDFDRLDGETTLRNRRDGDRIRPYGLGGEKKLKDYFIDQKVPQDRRSAIPLIAQDSRVIWIVGMRTSDDFRAREETRNVWVLSWRDLQDGGEST